MNNDVRSRIVAPILIPIAILGAMALLIGSFALMLLYNTHTGSLMLAAVAAGGILFTVALAASNDRLDRSRGFVVVGAAVLPLLVGGAVAGGLVGDVDDADRMANVQPLEVVPDDAPVIAAENSIEFCLPDEAGACEPTDTWEVVPSAEVETVAFVFDNLESGVGHNVAITELEGTPESPEQGELLLESAIVTGPVTDYYEDDQLTWEDLPEQWYFFCEVHPNMNGVGQLAAAE